MLYNNHTNPKEQSGQNRTPKYFTEEEIRNSEDASNLTLKDCIIGGMLFASILLGFYSNAVKNAPKEEIKAQSHLETVADTIQNTRF